MGFASLNSSSNPKFSKALSLAGQTSVLVSDVLELSALNTASFPVSSRQFVETIQSQPLANRDLPVIAFETLQDTSSSSATVRATQGLLGHQFNIATVLMPDRRKTHIRTDYYAVPPTGCPSRLAVLIGDDYRGLTKNSKLLSRVAVPAGPEKHRDAPTIDMLASLLSVADTRLKRVALRPIREELSLDVRPRVLQRHTAIPLGNAVPFWAQLAAAAIRYIAISQDAPDKELAEWIEAWDQEMLQSKQRRQREVLAARRSESDPTEMMRLQSRENQGVVVVIVQSVFRPCIDLHNGEVKQIVGGTLHEDDSDESRLKTNFVASHPSPYYAELYKKHNLEGGHVIKLGPGNDQAAKEALAAWPGHLQVGGGITAENAREWLDAGASKVIVTSYLFPEGKFSLERLKAVCSAVGKDRLVVDVSCRKRGDKWLVAMNKWQTITDMEVCKESLDLLAEHCSEFLIHAADVEGLCQGIDEELVKKLGEWASIPTTYAGGAKSVADLELVDRLSNGKVDLTYGSSLDIFGGSLVKFDDLVNYNNQAVAQSG
ncbi:hypothetical protein ONZ51_g5824 [Trametes cubensis]|uniref:1-(5-phosphoribosyl)-5-[(5-phosphoribosylamino)methylideneamino] imidazole-4-carboxamide isomerase n=1 Tax=Trametes cubensis TaxID=1111947 RepID=A0AAD7TTA0_9APHY|nr:hypothetical protein ONZ51_g5824 [Trametes cubensis]